MSNKQLFGLLGGILAGIAVKKVSSGSKAKDPEGRVFPRDFNADISDRGGVAKDITVDQWDRSYINFYNNINWDDYLASSSFLNMHFMHIAREEMLSEKLNHYSITNEEKINEYYIKTMEYLESERIHIGVLLYMRYNDERFLNNMSFASYIRLLEEIEPYAYSFDEYKMFSKKYDDCLSRFTQKRSNITMFETFDSYWRDELFEISDISKHSEWNIASISYSEFLRKLSGGINPSISFLEILRFGSYIERSCDFDFYDRFFDSVHKMAFNVKKYARKRGVDPHSINYFKSIYTYVIELRGKSTNPFNFSTEYLKLCYFLGDFIVACYELLDSNAWELNKNELTDLIRSRALSVFSAGADDLANLFMIRSVIGKSVKVFPGSFMDQEIRKTDIKIMKEIRKGSDIDRVGDVGREFVIKSVLKNLQNVDTSFPKKVKKKIIDSGIGGRYFREISINEFDEWNEKNEKSASSIVYNKTSFLKDGVNILPSIKKSKTIAAASHFLSSINDPSKYGYDEEYRHSVQQILYYIMGGSERSFLESFISSKYMPLNLFTRLVDSRNKKNKPYNSGTEEVYSFKSLQIKGFNISCYSRKDYIGSGISIDNKVIEDMNNVIDVTLRFFLEGIDKNGKAYSGILPLFFYGTPDSSGVFSFDEKRASGVTVNEPYHLGYHRLKNRDPIISGPMSALSVSAHIELFAGIHPDYYYEQLRKNTDSYIAKNFTNSDTHNNGRFYLRAMTNSEYLTSTVIKMFSKIIDTFDKEYFAQTCYSEEASYIGQAVKMYRSERLARQKSAEQQQRLARQKAAEQQQRLARQKAEEQQRLAKQKADLESLSQQYNDMNQQGLITPSIQQQAEAMAQQKIDEINDTHSRIQDIEEQIGFISSQQSASQKDKLLPTPSPQEVRQAWVPLVNPKFIHPRNYKMPKPYESMYKCLISSIHRIETSLQPDELWQIGLLRDMRENAANISMESIPYPSSISINEKIKPWTFYKRIVDMTTYSDDIYDLSMGIANEIYDSNCYWPDIPSTCLRLDMKLIGKSKILPLMANRRTSKSKSLDIIENTPVVLRSCFVGMIGEIQYVDFLVEIPKTSFRWGSRPYHFNNICVTYRMEVSGDSGHGRWITTASFLDDDLLYELGKIWLTTIAIMGNRVEDTEYIFSPHITEDGVIILDDDAIKPKEPNKPSGRNNTLTNLLTDNDEDNMIVVKHKDMPLALDENGLPIGRYFLNRIYVPSNTIDSEGKPLRSMPPVVRKKIVMRQDRLDDYLSTRDKSLFQSSGLRSAPFLLFWPADMSNGNYEYHSSGRPKRTKEIGNSMYFLESQTGGDDLIPQNFIWDYSKDRPYYYYKVFKQVEYKARRMMADGTIEEFNLPYMVIVDVI